MTFDEWLSLGVENGWCSEPVCCMHDAVPSTDEESAELDEGYDPCLTVVRIWGD